MGSPIRILHVAVNMNRGGAETLIMNIYRNLDRSKIQFDFLTFKNGVFDEEIKHMGGRIFRIPYVTESGHFTFKSNLLAFFMKHQEYKIVHSHMDKMSGIVLDAAKKAGYPVRISHSHNTKSEGNLIIKLYKWFSGKMIVKNATSRIACSEAAADWLFPGLQSETVIMKNAVDFSAFAYSNETRLRLRQELGIDQKTLLLGHVGRFNKQKNHEFLLDIFFSLKKRRKDIVLCLAGEGPMENKLREKVEKNKLKDSVLFLGVRDDIPDLLQAMDLLVFPSLFEGLPVSILEAQAAGLPCVISDRISRETDIGLGLVEFLPLAGKERWVARILEYGPNDERGSQWMHNGSLPYSIESLAEEMENYYDALAR